MQVIYKNKRALLTILQAFLIFAASSGCSGSSGAVYSTEIKCTEFWLTSFPGTTVTFNIQVRNLSPIYDDYLIYIDDPPLPDNWTANFYFQNRKVKGITIESGQSVSMVLQIDIPEDVSPGDHEFGVYAEGKYSDAMETLAITVESIPSRIDVYCPHDWQVTYPPSIVTFNFQVRNFSPRDDNYFIYIDNPPLPDNWTANFYVGNKRIRTFGATPEETVDLILEVGVPEDAAPKDYRFRVRIDGNYVSATLALTVTVPSIPRKIDLYCPFPSQSILTGQSASYLVKITNDGDRTEKILLGIDATSEMMLWEFSFSEDQSTLSSKESRWITLDAKPPVAVEEGDYPVHIIASTEDGGVTATIQMITRILANYLLEITGVQPINPQVSSGEKIETIVTVRNLGRSPLTGLKLNVNSTAISNMLITPMDVLFLEPMASVDFFVRISPDFGLTPGDYIIEVQAESSETKSSVRPFAVSVVSPVPWFWISICITVIATAVAVIAVQKLISRWQIGVRLRK